MKRKYYIILVILAVFVVTNPSITAFKNYLGSENYEGLSRPVNLFVFSFYKDVTKLYVGVFGNFFWINRPSEKSLAEYKKSEKQYQDSIDRAVTDSSWHPPAGDSVVRKN